MSFPMVVFCLFPLFFTKCLQLFGHILFLSMWTVEFQSFWIPCSLSVHSCTSHLACLVDMVCYHSLFMPDVGEFHSITFLSSFFPPSVEFLSFVDLNALCFYGDEFVMITQEKKG